MTKLFRLSLLLVSVFLFSATTFAQDAETAEFKVTVGFHCANGKQLLETKLAEVKGIESFVVNLETKVIDFKYDPTIISKEGIITEIEKIGYYTEFSDKNKEINKACSHGEKEHGGQSEK